MSEYPKIMYEQDIDGKPRSVRVLALDLSSAECTIPTYVVRSGGGAKSRCSLDMLFKTERQVLDKSIMECVDSIVINKKEIEGHHSVIEMLIKTVRELEEMRSKL